MSSPVLGAAAKIPIGPSCSRRGYERERSAEAWLKRLRVVHDHEHGTRACGRLQKRHRRQRENETVSWNANFEGERRTQGVSLRRGDLVEVVEQRYAELGKTQAGHARARTRRRSRAEPACPTACAAAQASRAVLPIPASPSREKHQRRGPPAAHVVELRAQDVQSSGSRPRSRTSVTLVEPDRTNQSGAEARGCLDAPSRGLPAPFRQARRAPRTGGARRSQSTRPEAPRR